MLGFINVYKPSGITSNAVISRIKRRVKPNKVGHMGTLDPMAEGVLPIAIGNATRMFDYFLNKTKTYVATFEFGYETDTLDATGNIERSTDAIPTCDMVKEALSSFLGKNNQLPPKYSAKNVNGRRAYDMAREGIEFELNPKEIEIFEFEYISHENNSYVFKITCSSGTYIRSICRDLGYKLGSLATMTKLIRTACGKFNIENAVSLEDLDSIDDLTTVLLAIDEVFDYVSFETNVDESARLKNGMTINCSLQDGLYIVFHNFSPLGIGDAKNNSIKLKTHF